MQSNYAIFQKQPNTVGSFLEQGIGGLLGPRFTTDVNDATAVLQSDFTDLNSLAPIVLDNPTDVFGNIIAENLLQQQEGPRIFTPTHGDPLPPEMLPPPIYDFDYPEPAPIDPGPPIFFDPPITSDPGQAERIPDDQLTPEQFDSLYGPRTSDPGRIARIPDDQLTAEQLMALYGDDDYPRPAISPTPGGDGTAALINELPPEFPEVADQFIPGIEEGPVVVSEPIGQPMDTTTTTDTGTNPFYAGATNVAQPPSMTPVAPSFGLDVGVGSYGTPANTAGFSHPNIGGFGGFNLPSTPTAPEPTPTTATGVAPQTTATSLPTVNSFAGFNGFGGFGGF